MGPTFFLYPRVLDDIFAACGREMAREIDLIRLDPQYDLIFEAGGHIKATGGPAAHDGGSGQAGPAGCRSPAALHGR